MTTTRSADYLTGLVRELCKLTGEVEWVEFKHNKANPQEIGEGRKMGRAKRNPSIGNPSHRSSMA